MTTDCLSVYVTVATREEAEKIVRIVLAEGLAACANILSAIHSIYRWQGKIEQADECALILKTTTGGFEVLQNRIKQLHSYDCPCIVAWPIIDGNPAYLDWIRAETSK